MSATSSSSSSSTSSSSTSSTSSTASATAYLELIIGPMFSGKTSRLVDIYKQCKFCNITVAVINHCIDERYHETLLSTHDKVMIPCIKTDILQSVLTNITDAQVVIINEGQFFNDLYEVVLQMIHLKKKIYIGGLDGDFERKKFGQILDLIPLCDKVSKLTSLCSICKDGTPGIFSKRITTEKEQTVVGSDNYIPVCRKCY